ncbi:hypothetical protein H3C61_02355 [Candidatus Gracilibacteria bacterium]|nr:hypothetical protein [Candidatus Gracilibacteria bacterium]
MDVCKRENLPLDHGYYRTISPVYEKYLTTCNLKIQKLNNNKFGWIKNIFGLFQIAKFERVDEEPNIEELKKNGFKHGIVIWIPYTRCKNPTGWKNLWLNSHFTTTGFSIIENEFYYKKWKERAIRARKKFLNNSDLRIELVDTDIFQKYYKEAKISQPYKYDFMKYHKTISSFDKQKDIKNMICFYNGQVVAGLSVIDYNNNSSAHLVSFLTNEGKTLQAGTGLIDFWFKNSFKNGLKYINFDHLKDKYMGKDQQGYTDFKENFMDYKVLFEDSYFKII